MSSETTPNSVALPVVNHPEVNRAVSNNISANRGKLLPILTYPDPRLNEHSQPVINFDEELVQLVRDMHTTMRENDGIGIAAPQVGVLKRVIVLHIEENKPIVLVNPKIVTVDTSRPFKWEEGCLSVPGVFEKRERPNYIRVQFQNEFGEELDLEFLGLYAFAVQHEIDHLNGKTFVDGASLLKRERMKAKIKKYLTKRQREKQKTVLNLG